VSGVEDEEGIVEEDISNYTKSGDIYYKTIWKPRSSIFLKKVLTHFLT